jgi:hypothetical protein
MYLVTPGQWQEATGSLANFLKDIGNALENRPLTRCFARIKFASTGTSVNLSEYSRVTASLWSKGYLITHP